MISALPRREAQKRKAPAQTGASHETKYNGNAANSEKDFKSKTTQGFNLLVKTLVAQFDIGRGLR